MYVYHMAGANMYVATSQMQQQMHYIYIDNITHTVRLENQTQLPVQHQYDFFFKSYTCTVDMKYDTLP